MEALKSFLTRRDFTFRVPYARAEVTRPARASFFGTVNPDNTGFLNDPTGSRRFLCLRLKPKAAGGIDWAYATALDPRAVWAHAVALYRADPWCWRLVPDEAAVRDEINHGLAVEDPVEEFLLEAFHLTPGLPEGDEAAPFLSSASIVATVERYLNAGTTRAVQMAVGRAMKSLDVTKTRRGDTRGYVGITRKRSGAYGAAVDAGLRAGGVR